MRFLNLYSSLFISKPKRTNGRFKALSDETCAFTETFKSDRYKYQLFHFLQFLSSVKTEGSSRRITVFLKRKRKIFYGFHFIMKEKIA